MKKLLVYTLALCMLLSMLSFAAAENKDYTDVTIRIYSNSNSTERALWLKEEAKAAGFTISMDDNSVISGDTAAIQAANEKKDGDILFGLNETRWGQVVGGVYENLNLVEWTPTWADKVGDFKYDGLAYGLVIQNILMLYRNDELGTNGVELHFDHWADLVDTDYTWYRQGKVGGTTNANINSSLLYPFADPTSPAGGISIDGWKMLWKYNANGIFNGDSYGFDALNRGEVQVSTFYSSSLYGKIDVAAEGSKNPLRGTMEPENWNLVDIKDGSYYIAEYIGILDRPDRNAEETEAALAFAEWFGTADVQAKWGEEFDSYPCNKEAADMLYPDGVPPIYQLPNFALNQVEGTDMNYAEYVGAHSSQWTNIMTNLGFYWADMNAAPSEPVWENLDWTTLVQASN